MHKKKKKKKKKKTKQKKKKKKKKKIQLVKDLLPISLRPGGLNPLDILHGALSIGIHSEDNKECLESSESIRKVLNFLVKRLIQDKKDKVEFKEGIKHLLERKRKRLEKKKSK